MQKIVREEKCEEVTGLSRTTRWRLEKLGRFPKRRQLGDNSVGWLQSELDEWLASRPIVDRKHGDAPC
jgi:prophage regulatory protein